MLDCSCTSFSRREISSPTTESDLDETDLPRSEIDSLEVDDRSILEKNPMTRCDVERRKELSTPLELVLADREAGGRGLSILDISFSSSMTSRRDVERRSQLVVVDMIELSPMGVGCSSLL